MRYLATVAAFALCTGVSAQSVVLEPGSPVTVTNSISSNSSSSSITSNDSSSVTNSVNADTGVSTSSIVGRTGSMCSAVVEGRRCEITCQAPQVAQCGKGVEAGEPSCACK